MSGSPSTPSAGSVNEHDLKPLFNRILEIFKNLKLFRTSPKFFVMYAWDNQDVPNPPADEKVVHELIDWFKDAGCKIRSDRTEAARDIIESQLCLLPYKEHEENSVKFVVVCGSELLGHYTNSTHFDEYAERMVRMCNCGQSDEERREAVNKVYDEHVELRKQQGRVLHHVETEAALLKIRVKSGEKDSIILVQLNGKTQRSFPSFLTENNAILRTELGPDGSKYECFLQVLEKLVDLGKHEQGPAHLIQSMIGVYSKAVEELRRSPHQPLTDSSLDRHIYKANSAYKEWIGSCQHFPNGIELKGLNSQGRWLVPFERNDDFVGRDSILACLRKTIPPNADNKKCQRTVIEGLGGIGKTQIVLEAAFRVRNQHPDCSIFWVPAIDATSFENAYREIGQQLKVPGIDQDNADVKSFVRTALSAESAGNWLLIVDNADEPDLLFGDTGLASYLPSSNKGSILFTTRNHEVAVQLDRNVIAVEKMSGDEALELLKIHLKDRQTHDTEDTAILLELLAYLPLAIRQASAYMAINFISTTGYLELYRSSDEDKIKLLSRPFADRRCDKTSQKPVTTTWLISFRHISDHHPLAARYLKFMCFLAEENIPRSLLPPAGKERQAVEAIGTLRAYAFITQRGEQDAYDIHRLVQLVMRSWLKEEKTWNEFVTCVIQRLAEAFPSPEHENKALWIKYLPHARTALDFQKDARNKKAKTNILFAVGESLDLLGKYQEAEVSHRQALKLREDLLGKRHSSTLASMNKVAVTLRNQGKYKEAEALHRRVLRRKEKVLGKKHRDTLTSVANLGLVLRDQGKYKEAEPLLQRGLRGREEILGKEHRDTLISVDYLAVVLRDQGRHKEAEPLFRRALQGREKVLMEGHPDTLSSMNNMARVLCFQRKYKEAEELHRQVLDRREKVLGEEHPDTLASINNLAVVLRYQHKYGEAETLYKRALDGKKEVLGSGHIYVLLTAGNLAILLRDQHRYEEAEAWLRQVLEKGQGILGGNHPDVLTTVNNLAVVLRDLGKYEEAEPLFRQVLHWRDKALGELNPKTMASVRNLISVLERQGKYEEAEVFRRRVPRPRL